MTVWLLAGAEANGQRADSIVVQTLRQEGVRFSHDNSVTLLMNGQEKFDDMFKAIRQAKSSVHLEYFNFRNDSIASLLFDILADKAKEGVEVRALYDAFGNSSNSQPLKKPISATYGHVASKSMSSTPSASRGLTMCFRATIVR